MKSAFENFELNLRYKNEQNIIIIMNYYNYYNIWEVMVAFNIRTKQTCWSKRTRGKK